MIALRAALLTILVGGGWALVAQPDWLFHRESPQVSVERAGSAIEVRVASPLPFEYTITVNGQLSAAGRAEGSLHRVETSLLDGEYQVRVSVVDQGLWRNRAVVTRRVVIDTTPPQVTIEAPGAVPADSPVTGRLMVDDPGAKVTLTLGERPVELDPADLKFAAAWPGGEPVELVLRARAVDGHGNLAEFERRVAVVRPLRLTIDAPSHAEPGAAVTIRVRPTSALSSLRIGGHDRQVSTEPQPDGSWVALVPVPLGASPGLRRLQVTGTAAGGSQAGAIHYLTVNLETRPVQNVFLPEETLALASPENQRAEAAILGRVYALMTPRKWNQTWALPLEARISAGYGVGFRFRPEGAVSYHRGVDFAAPVGAPVAAANSGVVAITGEFTIRGGLVVIDHGLGVTSEYMHLAEVLVREGQAVSRGQVIGRLGGTGFVSGPHLHWEMRLRGESVDPLAWVGRLWP